MLRKASAAQSHKCTADLFCLTPSWWTHALHKKGKAKISEWSLIWNNIIAIAMFAHGHPLMNIHGFTSYKQGSSLILGKEKGWEQTDNNQRKKTLDSSGCWGKMSLGSSLPESLSTSTTCHKGKATLASWSAWPCYWAVFLHCYGLKHVSQQRRSPCLCQPNLPYLLCISYAVANIFSTCCSSSWCSPFVEVYTSE